MNLTDEHHPFENIESTAFYIKNVVHAINIINARIHYLNGTLKTKENATRTSDNVTEMGACLKVKSNYLWDVAIFENLKNDLLKAVSIQKNLEENLCFDKEVASQLCSLLEELDMLCKKEEIELQNLINKQRQIVREISQCTPSSSYLPIPKEIPETVLKTKIMRAIINGILAATPIDFDDNPELLELKIKWRKPMDLSII